MTLRDDLNHEKLMHQVFEQNANEYLLRAEAAEARAASKSELIDNIVSTWEQMTARLLNAEADRDELRRQLSEAQRAIDVLSQTVVAQNNEIKRLRQKREDVAEYRAEIARLNQAATA